MSSEGPTQIFAEPPLTSQPAAVIDIIFVHGLGGDRFDTWQKSEGAFWPRWLAEKFPNCRVYVVGYDSNIFAGFLAGEGASIHDLALAMIDGIASREESAPNTLLVAHSLGGLIVKQMLRRCEQSANTDFNAIGRAVVGVAFLGTPHQGAHAAASLDTLLRRFKSKQVKQLTYSDDNLIDLNEYFRAWVARRGANVRSYYETEMTGKVHIVDKVTANPGVLGSEPIAVQANHFDICKPATKNAPVYKSICAMVRQLLKQISSPSGAGSDGETKTESVEGGSAGTQPFSEIGDDVVPPDVLADFEYYTTMAEHDRRDLEQKLSDVGRSYAIQDAKRKKERFNMALQRHIAQPSAVTRYTQLMADVEGRFNRHVSRVVDDGAHAPAIDQAIQDQVIGPCTATHSTVENEITSGLVDGALYYLAGNCHLAWDNG